MNPTRFVFALALVAFGYAIGLMAGLSVSPVVAALIGILAPVAAGLVTWKSDLTNVATQPPKLAFLALVLGPLSLGLIGGIVGGVYARTHGSFSPEPVERVAQWTAAGLTQEKALELVVSEALQGKSDTGTGVTANSVLFASHGTIGLAQYQSVFEGGNLESMLSAFKALSGSWSKLGTEIKGLALTDAQKVEVAKAIYRSGLEAQQ